MRREVLLSRQAETDIDSILTWLENRSPVGAKNWFAALESALKWLAENADSCPVAPENDRFEETVQQRLFKTRHGRRYRILFTLADQKLLVLHVRGPGQDLGSPWKMIYREISVFGR
jgi:plasmid stabilization system protein ParE